MGVILGVICIIAALVVGIGITVIANNSVRNFKEENHVRYTGKPSTSYAKAFSQSNAVK